MLNESVDVDAKEEKRNNMCSKGNKNKFEVTFET